MEEENSHSSENENSFIVDGGEEEEEELDEEERRREARRKEFSYFIEDEADADEDNEEEEGVSGSEEEILEETETADTRKRKRGGARGGREERRRRRRFSHNNDNFSVSHDDTLDSHVVDRGTTSAVEIIQLDRTLQYANIEELDREKIIEEIDKIQMFFNPLQNGLSGNQFNELFEFKPNVTTIEDIEKIEKKFFEKLLRLMNIGSQKGILEEHWKKLHFGYQRFKVICQFMKNLVKVNYNEKIESFHPGDQVYSWLNFVPPSMVPILNLNRSGSSGSSESSNKSEKDSDKTQEMHEKIILEFRKYCIQNELVKSIYNKNMEDDNEKHTGKRVEDYKTYYLYRKVYTTIYDANQKECLIWTGYYEPYKSFFEVLREICSLTTNYENYMAIGIGNTVSTMKNIIERIWILNHEEIPDLIVSHGTWCFKNGIIHVDLNQKQPNVAFIPYSSLTMRASNTTTGIAILPEFPLKYGQSAYKYFRDISINFGSTDNDDKEEEEEDLDPKRIKDFYIDKPENIKLPALEQFFQYQQMNNEDLDTFLFMCGRMALPFRMWDKLQIALWILGPPNAGKSSLIKTIAKIYPSNDVFWISSYQKIFGSSAWCGKKLVLSTETVNIDGTSEYNNITSGDPITVTPKGQTSVSKELKTFFLFGGNEFPKWSGENYAAWLRRSVVFNIGKTYNQAKDPNRDGKTLEEKLHEEFGLFLLKSLCTYKKFIIENPNPDFWKEIASPKIRELYTASMVEMSGDLRDTVLELYFEFHSTLQSKRSNSEYPSEDDIRTFINEGYYICYTDFVKKFKDHYQQERQPFSANVSKNLKFWAQGRYIPFKVNQKLKYNGKEKHGSFFYGLKLKLAVDPSTNNNLSTSMYNNNNNQETTTTTTIPIIIEEQE